MNQKEKNNGNGRRVDWAKWVDRLGTPMVLLLVLLWGGWSALSWTATHVVEPVVQRHMQFMETTEQLVKQQGETLARHEKTLSAIEQNLELINERLAQGITRHGSDS